MYDDDFYSNGYKNIIKQCSKATGLTELQVSLVYNCIFEGVSYDLEKRVIEQYDPLRESD